MYPIFDKTVVSTNFPMEYNISQIAFEFKQTIYSKESLYALKYKKKLFSKMLNI